MNMERRQAKRVLPKICLQLVIDCATPVIGNIKDLSENGLSVEYEGIRPIDRSQGISVSILSWVADTESIVNLACIPVYDIPILAHDFRFSGRHMRLLGMVYDNPGPVLASKLSRLLASIAESD